MFGGINILFVGALALLNLNADGLDLLDTGSSKRRLDFTQLHLACSELVDELRDRVWDNICVTRALLGLHLGADGTGAGVFCSVQLVCHKHAWSYIHETYTHIFKQRSKRECFVCLPWVAWSSHGTQSRVVV